VTSISTPGWLDWKRLAIADMSGAMVLDPVRTILLRGFGWSSFSLM